MRTRKRHLFRWVAVGCTAAAMAAPAVQAAGIGSDDRAQYRGSSATLAPTAVSPDDRAQYRGSSAAPAPTGLSPDDRVLYRGTSATPASTSLGPDDRSLSRSVHDIALRAVPVGLTVRPGGFDWEDAAIGGLFGLALALFGTGAFAMVHHHRGTLSAA